MATLDTLLALGLAVVAGVSFWLGRKSTQLRGAAWHQGWRWWK